LAKFALGPLPKQAASPFTVGVLEAVVKIISISVNDNPKGE
jgi:hypothetical protein